MAAVLTTSDGDLRRVMKTMLDSREFWSRGAYNAKIKTPFEYVIGARRATGADVDFAFGIAQRVRTLGQPLYQKPEPNGYANTGTGWVNSSELLRRMNFAVALASGKLPGVRKREPLPAETLASPDSRRK